METDKILLLGGVVGSFYIILMVVLFTINFAMNQLEIRVENDCELNARRFALAQETGIFLTLDEAREIAIAEDHEYYIK